MHHVRKVGREVRSGEEWHAVNGITTWRKRVELTNRKRGGKINIHREKGTTSWGNWGEVLNEGAGYQGDQMYASAIAKDKKKQCSAEQLDDRWTTVRENPTREKKEVKPGVGTG